MTAGSAKIWMRAPRPGVYACHVSPDEAPGAPVPGAPFAATATAARGCTVTFDVRLPRADARYRYDVRDGAGESIVPAASGPPRFRAAPPDGAPDDFRFGLVSCHSLHAYADPARRAAMWRRLGGAVAEHDVRFLLAAGDQVYADQAYASLIRQPRVRRADAVDRYRRMYQAHWNDEAVTAVLSRCPTYMVWDDHEIRDGWGSFPDDRTHPKKRTIFSAARQVYGEFQHAHNPAPFGPRALHYAFRFADAGFLVLDLRGCRDRSRRARPLLGRRQWPQLLGWAADQDPGLRVLFVVASVPLIHVKGTLAALGGRFTSDLRDQWTHPVNRPEQRELLRSLFDLANGRDVPVVILGGDVHVGTIAAVRSHDRGHERRPVIYQLTSSPISNRPLTGLRGRIARGLLHGPMDLAGGFTGRILEYVDARNFGMVHVHRDAVGGPRLIRLCLHREGVDEPLEYSIR